MSNHRVKVIDSVMGSGKTTYAIDYMNSHPEETFFYVTPFITETERIRDACPNLNFHLPDAEDSGFPSKTKHLQWLIEKNHNISAAHKLFEIMNDRIIELLRDRNYTLLLDESIDVLGEFKNNDSSNRKMSKEHSRRLLKDDVDALLETGFAKLNDDGKVSWVGKRLSKYDKVKDRADRNILYYINNNAIMWSFPHYVFEPDVFKSITIMTYQFEYQLFSSYLKYFKIEYDKYYIKRGIDGNEIVPFDDGELYDLDFRKRIRDKIKIVDDEDMNSFGDVSGIHPTSLSSSWWERNGDEKGKEASRLITSFFRNNGALASNRAWTAYVDAKDKQIPKTKYLNENQWIAFSSRATNKYRERDCIAYFVNVYPNVNEINFFKRKGLGIKNEEYATASMLQFLFRFAVRDDKEILVYIPSWRMRTLLKLYLDGRPPSELYVELAKYKEERKEVSDGE